MCEGWLGNVAQNTKDCYWMFLEVHRTFLEVSIKCIGKLLSAIGMLVDVYEN